VAAPESPLVFGSPPGPILHLGESGACRPRLVGEMTGRLGPPTWIFWVILLFVIVMVLVYFASTQLTVGTAS